MSTHAERIRDQFTRQAAPFRAAATVRDEAPIRLVLSMTAAGPDDRALDVACGPGVVACAFAAQVRHATGLDVTPAMLSQAREEAASRRLTNLAWTCGDATRLPFSDGAFSIVICRFAFHHVETPHRVLDEMRRVCAPGGRVAVVDSAPAAEKADAFNAMEKLRDPSHVHAMPLGGLLALFHDAGFGEVQTGAYRLRSNLDDLLSRSFPQPGDEERVRAIFARAVDHDDIDMDVTREEGTIRYGFPVAVLVATR